MKCRRGFKTEANWYALEFRKGMNLSPESPLDPWDLAEFLGVDVVRLSSASRELHEFVGYLKTRGRSHFSAVTVSAGLTKRFIVYNDYNAKTRSASDVAHELSHVILHHPLFEMPSDGNILRDSRYEDEARWMSGSLLVTNEAAMSIARQKLPLVEASQQFGVSSQLMKWRLNATGACRRFRHFV